MVKPSAFLEIFRLREDGARVGVFRSERKKNTSEPIWDPCKRMFVDE